METFLTLAALPFLIGAAIVLAGVVVRDTTKGWHDAGGMAALSGAFQIWMLGFLTMALFGGW